MCVSRSVDIEAPPDQVWPYLVEPEKTMSWFTSLKVFDWTSDADHPVWAISHTPPTAQ